MNRLISYYIDQKFNNKTVEYFLKSEGFSTKLITYIKRTEDGLTIKDSQVYTNHVLKEGDTLKVFALEEIESKNIVPKDMKIDIIFEDEDIMIINKEAMVPIHPSQGNFDNSLANAIMYYFQQKGVKFVFRCINRLDKNTTGLLIIAKNMISASILSKMMQNREIYREYRAIVSGIIEENGIINAPIAREADSTITRCIDFNNGDSAITHFQRISYQNHYSYVSISLETGRTHQIRVHMKYIGHNLLGDSLYEGDCSRMGRHALHSYKLIFNHPITKERMEFVSEIPEDMSELLL